MSTWFRDTDESRRMLAEERLVLAASELTSEALERRGQTRSWLAERLGVGLSEVSQRLSGRRNLTLRSFAAMLHELGYTLELGLADERNAQAGHSTDGTRVFHGSRATNWPQGNMRYTPTQTPIRLVHGGGSAA